MLLTGFDAPIEGVMYLDRPIREAELLQTIARVNRTGHGKKFGIVVDYYGLAHHLKEALNVYADEDIDGALQSLKDEIPVLRDRHLRVVDLFRSRGIESLADIEACVEALADERLRAEFAVKLKAFLDTLDVVLPRPEGLPFVADAKLLAFIYARARNRYRDTPVLGKDVGAKVRKLIDDHVVSMGVDPKIPPISLTDADFGSKVAREPNDRAKASEMEHAIRAHIREHLDQDPVAYRKLSERLRDVLDQAGRAVGRADQGAAGAGGRDPRRACGAGRPAAGPARALRAVPAADGGHGGRRPGDHRCRAQAAGGPDGGGGGHHRGRAGAELLAAEPAAGAGCAEHRGSSSC